MGDLSPSSSATPVGLLPSQVLSYYAINTILLQGGIVGDGSGQTIAIVDAYDNPNFLSSSDSKFSTSDLHQFDVQFGLAEPTGFFTKVNQTGVQGSYPKTDPTGGWETEEALDVEWAHAIAPKANIVLVEANDASNANMIQVAVDTARKISGVSVVSMSFGIQNQLTDPDASGKNDAIFHTPSGHTGVTFLAATGDTDAEGGYPAFSPTVLAVGGTVLTAASVPRGFTEAGWGDGKSSKNGGTSGGGGGISTIAEPDFQKILVPATAFGGKRTIPDVSFVAGTGVAVYDAYNNGTKTPWASIGGTSLACPCWAALIAIANQGRVANGLGTLDGETQTLSKLYTIANHQYNQGGDADFTDITSGNNGYAAGTGYDLVTGIGTPNANKLIPLLAASDIAKFSVTAAPTTAVAGSTIKITVTAEDANNNVIPSYNGTIQFSSSDGNATLPARYTFTGTGNDNGVHVFSVILGTAGNQTVTVTDTTNATGSVTVTVTPGAATHFSSQVVQQGSNFLVTIYALDKYGNVDTNFKGTVTFSSPNISNVPLDYTFTGSGADNDNGVHTFTITLPSGLWGAFNLDVAAFGLTPLDVTILNLPGHHVRGR